MKYRKKPVVIEAVQILASDFNGKTFDGSPFSHSPDWLIAALQAGTIVPVTPNSTDYAEWEIRTLEDGADDRAKHVASPGDWIIQGVKGELYPCKPDIFEATNQKKARKRISTQKSSASSKRRNCPTRFRRRPKPS